MSKGVTRNEVLDIVEFGLVFCVDTCNPEILKQVYFTLYRISLSGLIRFHRRITQIQNNFFYIEPLAITHKNGSMAPEIPDYDIYFLKNELFRNMDLIKNNLHELMNIKNEDNSSTKHSKTSYLKFIDYLLKKNKLDPASRDTTGKIEREMENFPEIKLDRKTIKSILKEIQQFNKVH